MAKKKNKSNAHNTNEKENANENQNQSQKKENVEGEMKKKESSPIPVVLKIDMHCDGCAVKITRCVRSFEGVQTVKADSESNKLTVVGNVDPTKLRDMLAHKAKKKVELLSPQPKKESKSDQKPDKEKADDKKPKEAPVTTAVLKVVLHCQGCTDKIQKTVRKTKGVQSMEIDKQKELVWVKGTMDAKALAQSLKEKLNRQVEIVPPKKEKEGEGEKQDGNGGGGGKKKGGGGDGGQEEAGAAAAAGNANKMIIAPPGNGNGYGYGYGYGYGHGGFVGEHLHAPQMFSDENPNACSIM